MNFATVTLRCFYPLFFGPAQKVSMEDKVRQFLIRGTGSGHACMISLARPANRWANYVLFLVADFEHYVVVLFEI